METHVAQVAMYLGAIIALILICGYLMKRVNNKAFQVAGPMQVKATLSLGIKEKLVLVQVGDQQLLLGVTPERIVKIQAFDEPVVFDEVDGFSNFKEKLQEIMKND